MSNAQDLLSILNNANAASRSSLRPPASTSGIVETSILDFKSGKMNATFKPNGKYLVEPDMRRGELHVVYCSSSSSSSSNAAAIGTTSDIVPRPPPATLKLEWRDRRTRTTVDTYALDANSTFERVETGRGGDRVYLLQRSGRRRSFFWMQDKDDSNDEELCVKVNLYIGDISEAASAAGIASPDPLESVPPNDDYGVDSAELLRMMQGALGTRGSGSLSGIDDGARLVSVPGNHPIPTAGAGQVDALGNILENLGIPGVGGGQPSGERNARVGTGGGGVGPGSAATPAPRGLTLADLQGAMAGLATASPVLGAPASASSSFSPSPSPSGPPLSELASADIVDESGILDDPSCVARLIALLPEGQQTEASLRENLLSPQVAQTLRRLTSALSGDDDDGGGFNSIIANFQLNHEDGAIAMATGNPIEAFLNCLLRDVERKEGIKKNDDDNDDKDGEEGAGNDDGGGGSGGDGDRQDGDVNMDES